MRCMTKLTVLVVEDEPDIREVVRYNLEREGYLVAEASTGEEALVLAREQHPDLVVLDLMLPGIQGLEVCRRLRERLATRDVPLVMLTAKGEEADIVSGLEMGADDYVTKPFSPRELVARIRSVLRRAAAREADGPPPRLTVGPLTLDSDRHEARLDGEPLTLTPAEFRLLACLAASPGRVYTREQLVRQITGGEHYIVERNIDVHVRALRKKLGEHADLLVTVRGVGYKLQGEAGG